MTSALWFSLFACWAFAGNPFSDADTLYLHRNVSGNLEKSITLLRARVNDQPSDAQAWWRLGRGLERLGEQQTAKKEKLAAYEEAKKALERSIELTPSEPEAHFFLGITLGRIGQTRGILRSLFLVGPIKREMKRTLELDPHHGGAHHVLGEMLRQIPGFAGGSKKGAVQELETSVELDPKRTTHYTALAQAYLDVGDKPKARQALERMFEIKDPADPGEFDDDVADARRMLQRL